MYGPRMQHAAAAVATWTEKLDPDVPPIEKSIARDRDLLIINPDPFPLGPDGHREPATWRSVVHVRRAQDNPPPRSRTSG